MRQATHTLTVPTRKQGLLEITREINSWVGDQNIQTGLLTLFLQHTSASLAIQENADPDVIQDINEWFRRNIRENEPWYRHTAEGPDDMPSHIRTILTQTSLSIPVLNGRPTLGTWQGIYLFEHRTHPHHRRISLHLLGE